MQERTTNILGWVVLISVMAALWGLFGETPKTSHIGRGDPLVANFAAKRDAVTYISFTKGTTTTLLTREAGAWQVFDGPTPDADKISAFLDTIEASIRREPKIGNTLRGARQGLDNVEPTVIYLLDDMGNTVLGLTTGRHVPAADGNSLTYVLVLGEGRSWLVTALPPLSADAALWLE